MRQRTLFPSTLDPNFELTEQEYGMLELVGRARRWGVSRIYLTKEYLKIDPRSAFHFSKKMSLAGIVKIKVRERERERERERKKERKR